jgi:predicted NBD/HSP70 family sugar kinase
MTDRPVIGFDLGGTKMAAAIVSADGNPAAVAKRDTGGEESSEKIFARICLTIREAIEKA